MFRSIEDFRQSWGYESATTLKVLEAIPDAALATAITAQHRDLNRLAWHLIDTLVEMPARMGLKVHGHPFMKALDAEPVPYAPPPSSAQARQAYADASESLMKQLASWTDATLLQEDDMYGMTWKRGYTLTALVHHQAHHRG
ncbi:MAG: DinB family protein, partial [Firmicutes bacterium]|nr:DinB family protein [Bacillota bacterium]